MTTVAGHSRRALLTGVSSALATATCACLATPASARPILPDATGTNRVYTATPTRGEIVARFGARRPTWWGMTGPGVVSRLPGTATTVALTFDACAGTGASGGYDTALVATLRRLHVPATFFLNSRWIAAHPSEAAALAADPLFHVESHGWLHRPLSVTGRAAYGITGTHDAGEVWDEVMTGVPWFERTFGRGPRWFRPGTAHTDDVGVAVVGALGQRFAGFSVNGDGGATFTAAQVASTVGAVRAGDIVLSHMNHPEGQTAEGYAAALPKLLARGVRFSHLP